MKPYTGTYSGNVFIPRVLVASSTRDSFRI